MDHIPWMKDLSIDIMVLPACGAAHSEGCEELELEEALHNGTIDESRYKLAKLEANQMNFLNNK